MCDGNKSTWHWNSITMVKGCEDGIPLVPVTSYMLSSQHGSSYGRFILRFWEGLNEGGVQLLHKYWLYLKLCIGITEICLRK